MRPRSISRTTQSDALPSELTSADWSTSDEDEPSGSAPTDLEAAKRRICALERKLKKTQQDYNDYRAFVGERLGRSRLVAALEEPASASSTRVAAPLHDDDSHYFQSYGENGKRFLHSRTGIR